MRQFLVLFFLLLLLPRFHSSNQCLASKNDKTAKKYLRYNGHPSTIVLETSRRKIHQITTRILKIFLEECLEYQNVSIVMKNGDFSKSSSNIHRLSGSLKNDTMLPETTINLEVWVPPYDNVIGSISDYNITDYGIGGPPVRFGWFVPTSLLLLPQMDHWRFFTTSENAKYFKLPSEKMNKVLKSTRKPNSTRYYCQEYFCKNGLYKPNRCKNASCATLLAGFSDITAFIKDHIERLKLYVEVVWVGPHLQQIVSDMTFELAKKNQTSLVFLTWTPSIMVVPGEPVHTIVFPQCEVYDKSLINCQYDMQKVVILAWSKLEHYANPIHKALLRIGFDLHAYIQIIKLYRKRTHQNSINQDQILYEIAREWLLANRQSTSSWAKSDDKTELYIGGIFPVTESNYNSASIASAYLAAQMATNAVQQSGILENYKLKLFVDDGKCQPDVVMKVFINYIIQHQFNKLVGILGPACSDTVEPLAGESRHFHTVVISYSAEGSSFSDRKKYPYFFRTIGENNQYQQVYLQLLNKLKWSKIGALSADGHKYTEYLAHLQVLLRKNNITFDFNNKFPPQENIENIKQYLQDMMKDNIHIIIGDVYDNIARIVMCIAFEMGMTSQNSYVWFLPSWLNSDWYDTDKYNKKNNETVWCNTEQMIQAINGYFSLSHAPYGPNDSLTNENITVKQWKEKLNITNSLSEYAGYAYDAVWMYAYALKKLYDENPTYLLELHSENTTKRLVEVLKQTNFQGVSGTIQFRNQASRISVVNVIQCYFKNISDKQMTTVAVFHPYNLINDQDPLAGLLSLNESLIHWLSPGGIRPTDGILPPPKCLVEGFKNLVGVKDCEVALVIANLLGFGFIGVVLSVIFIQIYKVKKKELEKIKNLPLLEGRLDRWEIPRNKLVINRKLGEGAFGDVYGGEAYFDEKGWIPVAVKALKVGSKSEEKLDFLSEAEVMKKFDHKNIIKLLAVCIRGEPTYTIMELMLYGDLKTFLLARRHLVNDIQSQYCREANEVSSKKLTMMALDVALALSYLAERKIVHRDVACRNVLVNAQRIVKLGDFGMTRLLGQKDYYKFNRKGMLPVRWMAPESLGLGIFTTSSDIWSYGVLLFEIITFGSFPFQGMSNYQVLEHVKAGNTLKIPSGVKPQMGKLIKYCWNDNYKLRPEASEIVEFLTNNPQLVTPCLDVPISSVQTEEDGISNMLLSETLKKCPLPSFHSKLKQPKYTQYNVQRHYNLSSSNNIPMVKMSSSPESKNDNEPKTEIREPLLKKENKYFTLDPSKKRKDSEEIMDFNNKNSSEESLL